MPIVITGCPAERLGEYLAVLESAFAESIGPEERTAIETTAPPERRLIALDGERIVGTAGVLPLRLRIPGSEAPAAGVTLVSVLASHRRRGILSQMMGRMLDDAYRRGEPLAALWASEAPIYQRFGYGLGALSASISVETHRTALTRAEKPAGSIRFVTADEAFAAFPAIYARVREERSGVLGRSPEWWRLRTLVDAPSDRASRGPKYFALYETDDGPEGYAIYRIKADWDPAGPRSTLNVGEIMTPTVRSTRDLWRWLFGIDLVRSVNAAHLPADHQLPLLVQDPRALRLSIVDGLWLRVVDAAAALAARRYEADGSICLDVRDERCPWNSGRWRLDVDGGKGRLRRSSDEPEIALDIADLGAAYLGGFSFTALARAGRIGELSAGAAQRATSLFRTPLAPWCPEVF